MYETPMVNFCSLSDFKGSLTNIDFSSYLKYTVWRCFLEICFYIYHFKCIVTRFELYFSSVFFVGLVKATGSALSLECLANCSFLCELILQKLPDVPPLPASNNGGVWKTRYFLAKWVNISKTVEIRPKLLLMTYRKLHMRFRLAPKPMTLDDLELL